MRAALPAGCELVCMRHAALVVSVDSYASHRKNAHHDRAATVRAARNCGGSANGIYASRAAGGGGDYRHAAVAALGRRASQPRDGAENELLEQSAESGVGGPRVRRSAAAISSRAGIFAGARIFVVRRS